MSSQEENVVNRRESPFLFRFVHLVTDTDARDTVGTMICGETTDDR